MKRQLAGAATAASLLSPLNNYLSSMILSQNEMLLPPQTKHLLDCFNDPIPDDAVIYMSDIPFQYNEKRAGILNSWVTKQVQFL